MLRKAESMLAMLLDVMARRRRHSAIIPAVNRAAKASGD